MNKILLFIVLISLCTAAHTQPCSVRIKDGNGAGQELTAIMKGGTPAKLTWYRDGSVVFGADTISSQSSITVVAGNNGSGSSPNQFGFPAGGIAVDADDNVYISDAANNRVQKWAPGALTGVTVAGGHGKGAADNQLSLPKDVFVDGLGNIYVADAANHRIQKWAPGAASGITVAGGNGGGPSANQLNGPRGVYVARNGDIYAADTYNYRIQKWKPGATTGITVAGGNGIGTAANQFYYPVDVYLDGSKNIYIADAYPDASEYHRVQKFAHGAASGTTVAGGNGTGTQANQFGYLLAIYVDDAGNVYATDNGVDGAPVSRVQKWASGAASGVTVAGGHTDGWDVLKYPTGIAVGRRGLIYVLDGTYNPRVQKYIPSNGIVNAKFSPSEPGSYTVRAVLKNGCTATSDTYNLPAAAKAPALYVTQPNSSSLYGNGSNTF